MGNGIPWLLRWLAAFGMGMAFVNFALAFSVWVAPTGGNGWFGKRFKDTISPPQVGKARPAGSPNPSGTP